MESSTSDKPFWEKAYQTPTGSAFGTPSPEIIELAATLPPGTTVLDLGCGDGRNSLFLAGHGFDVTAIDISEHGVNKIGSLAAQGSLDVKTEVADMRTWEFQRSFDLIISHGCLHLIKHDEWAMLLDRMKAHTSEGGYNVVAVFTDRIAPPPDLEAFCVGLFREGELFAHYADWEITLQQSYTYNDEHPGGIRHTHPINKVVARRGGSNS